MCDTPDVIIGSGYDGRNAVAGQPATIARVCFIGLEMVAVETAQAIPGGEPDKAFMILGNAYDGALRESVGRRVVLNVAYRLSLDNQAGNQHPYQYAERVVRVILRCLHSIWVMFVGAKIIK